MNSAPPRDTSNDIPEPIAWAIYGGRTGTLRYVERDEDHVRMLVEDGGYVASPLFEHSAPTPPSSNVREALAQLIANATSHPNWRDNPDESVYPGHLRAADAIIAAPDIGVPQRATVTDAEVEAALDVLAGAFHMPTRPTMRAALEAARKVLS